MTKPHTTVAYLGPAGTFTEAALLKLAERGIFGAEEINALPVRTPQEAADAVRGGDADFAVIAIENSVDGAVTTAFDALDHGATIQIYAEEEIAIAFSIMAQPGMAIDKITTFATHPVAYQQIKNWMSTHAPDAQFVAAPSNAAAAHMVANGEVDAAAAPKRAAELLKLNCLADNIIDIPGARTRFIALGKPGTPPARTGNDRTSVVFGLPNAPGSLVHALNEFASRGVDLSRIESRPTRKKFGTYRFHLDLLGHIDDAPVAGALRALHLFAEDMIFLGSWPATCGEKVESNPADGEHSKFKRAAQWVREAQGHD